MLLPEHIDSIHEAYSNREDSEGFCKLVSNTDILDNDCNLSISSYVEQEIVKQDIDIDSLNSEIEDIVNEGISLRTDVNSIIEKIRNEYGI